jgi:hypothetical protein
MRRASWFTVALILAIIASFIGAATGEASSSDDNAFFSKINNERASRGIATLVWSSNLARIAQQHSQEMADNNSLYHNQNIGNEVSDWQELGENDGYGPSVDDLHQAFMNSPEHRANILDTGYTEVGIGTVWKGSTLWVTEDFERPMSAARASSTYRSPVPRSTHRTTNAAAVVPVVSTPPRKPVTVPPPPPAPQPSGADYLTRQMVSDLLGGDEPAVGTIGAAEVLFADPTSSSDLASVTFSPFARMIGAINRALINGRNS